MSDWKARYRNWGGTAADLAAVVVDLLAETGVLEDGFSPNERLIRHYAQQGILERPERRGKEAIFHFRQIVEFLAARHLLQDGWPLAKIAEFNRASDLPHLLDLLPQTQESAGRAFEGPESEDPESEGPKSEVRGPNRAQALVKEFQRKGRPSIRPVGGENPDSPSSLLARSVARTKNRVAGRQAAQALGNPTDLPKRDTLVRLTLTPWCHVYFDVAILRQQPPETPELLGQVLTQWLTDEHTRPGDRK